MSSFQKLKLEVLEKVACAVTERDLNSVLNKYVTPPPTPAAPSTPAGNGKAEVLTLDAVGSSAPTIVETFSVEGFCTKLRKALAAHGVRGISGIARKFRQHDDNGNGKLDFQEYKKAILEYGFRGEEELSTEDLKKTFQYFDSDCSGQINYDEFLVGVRGPVAECRAVFINKAFDIMDYDKSGTIDLADIIPRYNCDKHPAVISGQKTKNEVMREFLDTFDGGVKDGTISREEWHQYYANVSASIDDDAYFELMMRNAWHISGGEGQSANTTCLRVLVTHEDGRQSVEEIENDFDIDKNDKKAQIKNLQARGMKVKDLTAVGNVGDAKSEGLQGIESPPSKLSSMSKTPNTAFRPGTGYTRRGDGGSQIVF